MSYKVKPVMCERAYCKSHVALKLKFMDNVHPFTKLYEREYNIKHEKGYLIFENETHYTMFLLRWT